MEPGELARTICLTAGPFVGVQPLVVQWGRGGGLAGLISLCIKKIIVLSLTLLYEGFSLSMQDSLWPRWLLHRLKSQYRLNGHLDLELLVYTLNNSED